jgi:hypothetical protein
MRIGILLLIKPSKVSFDNEFCAKEKELKRENDKRKTLNIRFIIEIVFAW